MYDKIHYKLKKKKIKKKKSAQWMPEYPVHVQGFLFIYLFICWF